MTPNYDLYADDVRVWSGFRPPTQNQIDLTAIYATKNGWNGTTLELRCDDVSRGDVEPSHEALEAMSVEDYYDILESDNACPSSARAE